MAFSLNATLKYIITINTTYMYCDRAALE